MGEYAVKTEPKKENYEAMILRHKNEIMALQLSCKHKHKTEWMPFTGRGIPEGAKVRLCEDCWKTIDEYIPKLPKCKTTAKVMWVDVTTAKMRGKGKGK